MKCRQGVAFAPTYSSNPHSMDLEAGSDLTGGALGLPQYLARSGKTPTALFFEKDEGGIEELREWSYSPCLTEREVKVMFKTFLNTDEFERC